MKIIPAPFIGIFASFLVLQAEGVDVITFTNKSFDYNPNVWIAPTTIPSENLNGGPDTMTTVIHPKSCNRKLRLKHNDDSGELLIENIGNGSVQYTVFDHTSKKWTGEILIPEEGKHSLKTKEATLYLSTS